MIDRAFMNDSQAMPHPLLVYSSLNGNKTPSITPLNLTEEEAGS